MNPIHRNNPSPDLALEYDAPRDTYVLHVTDLNGQRHSAVVDPATVEALSNRARDLLAGGPVLSVDDTTARLIAMAKDLKAQEPARPDTDRHAGTHLETIARTYDQWERHMDAMRLLIGVRLTSRALED